MSYENFVEFHEKHPDLDNAEYYAEFPDVNKSTIRSWKSRTRAPQPTAGTPPPPEPSKTQVALAEGFEEQQKHYIQLLMTQTGSKPSEFEGVDTKSVILILKNKIKNKQLQDQMTGRSSNSSILPSPPPIGQSQKHFGIDEYINFDVEANEIKMSIPMSKLMDPEENKIIRGKRA